MSDYKTFEVAINKPRTMTVKEAGIIKTKYGFSLLLKNEQDEAAFLPVDLANELLKAGATEGKKTDKWKGYVLPDAARTWVLEKVQLPGEDHATWHLSRPNGKGTAGVLDENAAQEPEPQPSKDDALIKCYQDSINRVARWIEAYNAVENRTLKFTSQDAAAMAATCFIARSRLIVGY